MREDFVTRLEHQLSNAERRRERGSRRSRLRASARAWLPSRAVSFGLATAAAVLIAVVVGAVALNRGGDENSVVGRSPSVVARTSLGEEPLEDLASGFGAAWIGGVERRDVVRVDAGTHRVVARIPVGDFPSGVVTAAGAVWVLVYPHTDLVESPARAVYKSPTLLRIDPATNRVAAPIPLPIDVNSYRPKLLGDSRALWVLGPNGGVRIDPRRSAVAGRVSWNFGGGVLAGTFGLGGDDLWVRADDGRLLRFDARTGARAGRASSPRGRASLAVIPGAGVVVGGEDGTLTRIDASTGRALWTTRLADTQPAYDRRDRTIALVGGAVWALSENSARGTERLTAVNLANGRTLSTATLKDSGGAGWLTPIAGKLWFITPTAQAVVVRP
jgi:outer membrane protein assembly factor BamB